MPYHADPIIIPTPGDRGKTTRRASTRTVRGPEGRWIAQMKEDVLTRPPGWPVKEERLYWQRWDSQWQSRTFTCGRFDTEAEACRHAATIPVGREHMSRSPNGDNYAVRVWVEKE